MFRSNDLLVKGQVLSVPLIGCRGCNSSHVIQWESDYLIQMICARLLNSSWCLFIFRMLWYSACALVTQLLLWRHRQLFLLQLLLLHCDFSLTSVITRSPVESLFWLFSWFIMFIFCFWFVVVLVDEVLVLLWNAARGRWRRCGPIRAGGCSVLTAAKRARAPWRPRRQLFLLQAVVGHRARLIGCHSQVKMGRWFGHFVIVCLAVHRGTAAVKTAQQGLKSAGESQ